MSNELAIVIKMNVTVIKSLFYTVIMRNSLCYGLSNNNINSSSKIPFQSNTVDHTETGGPCLRKGTIFDWI